MKGKRIVELEHISAELYQSLKWAMECIKFDNTNEDFRLKLVSTLKKYERVKWDY